ncbi:pro-platelet basic protein [Rhinolophus ferrumequinum]|uniref:C-X-C motif chemokine n=1 Tax=Rhinolophus ferrumequinum TaxID=59479 RepID=A0A671G5M1_RHIFE|nr:platelet basic protein-like isoform X2 [Rhinolophus ferrumequinum]KAF6372325.1 pro-platelet basic protein [Rhinolophus ferrumequinum]
MSLRASSTSSYTSPLHVLQMLLPLSLLLTMLVLSTIGKISILAESVDHERYAELRCLCIHTISGIHPSKIQNLEVIRAGPHCPKVQVIATLKNGKELCLNPEASRIKKIIQKFLEGDESAS